MANPLFAARHVVALDSRAQELQRVLAVEKERLAVERSKPQLWLPPSVVHADEGNSKKHALNLLRRLCDVDGRVASLAACDLDFACPDVHLPRRILVGSDGLHSIDVHASVSTWRFGSIIGEGAFGDVWVAELPVSSVGCVRVAIKQAQKAVVTELRQTPFVCRELRCLERVDHPLVVPYHGFKEGGGSVYTVLSLMDGGSLRQAIDGAKAACSQALSSPLIDELACRFVMACLVDVLSHLHEMGIVYRDLKPDNVMLHFGDGLGYPHLIDFGLARNAAVKQHRVAVDAESTFNADELAEVVANSRRCCECTCESNQEGVDEEHTHEFHSLEQTAVHMARLHLKRLLGKRSGVEPCSPKVTTPLSSSLPLRRHSTVGTVGYAAPEVFLGGPGGQASYSYPADVWSLGILLHEMLTGELPFGGPEGNPFAVAHSASSGLREDALVRLRGMLSPHCYSFLQLALSPVADERPSMMQLKCHPWFAHSTLVCPDTATALAPGDSEVSVDRCGTADSALTLRHGGNAAIDWEALRRQDHPGFVQPLKCSREGEVTGGEPLRPRGVDADADDADECDSDFAEFRGHL